MEIDLGNQRDNLGAGVQTQPLLELLEDGRDVGDVDGGVGSQLYVSENAAEETEIRDLLFGLERTGEQENTVLARVNLEANAMQSPMKMRISLHCTSIRQERISMHCTFTRTP